MGSSAPYDRTFYEDIQDGSSAGARIMLGALHDVFAFRTLVDIGCGTGAWPAMALELGAESVLGVDGAHVPLDRLKLPRDRFHAHDLEAKLPDLGRFDLALCLEVAEHLFPSRGPSLVEDLTGLSAVVAFSAAIPFQGGDGHVNEMWTSYWARLFAGRGYRAWTGLRSRLWADERIPWWYRQNIVLFVAEEVWQARLGSEAPSAPEALDVVHPECYLWAVRRPAGRHRTTFAQDAHVYHASANDADLDLPGYGQEFAN